MKDWLKAVGLPAGLAFINAFIWYFIPSPNPALAFNTVRVALCLWVGWRVRSRVIDDWLAAAFGGVAIVITDHVVFRGGSIALFAPLVDESYPVRMALLGVLISLVVLGTPVAAAVAVVGARLQKWWSRRQAVAVAS